MNEVFDIVIGMPDSLAAYALDIKEHNTCLLLFPRILAALRPRVIFEFKDFLSCSDGQNHKLYVLLGRDVTPNYS